MPNKAVVKRAARWQDVPPQELKTYRLSNHGQRLIMLLTKPSTPPSSLLLLLTNNGIESGLGMGPFALTIEAPNVNLFSLAHGV